MTDVVDALADLRDALAWPDDEADLTSRALAGIVGRRRRSRWPYVAAAAVVAVGVGVPVAAELLEIGGVRIELTGEVPDDIGRELLLGRPTQLRVDAARPPSLGPPAAAFEGRPEGGYTEVWPGPILLTQFPGSVDDQVIEKRAFGGSTVTRTTVLGEPAYWVSGPHGFLYLDQDGNVQEDTLRLSGNALIWTRDGITYRLESDRDLRESIVLAESMF